MKIENKICFFLNWSREIDMYLNIYKKFPKEQIIFLINNFNQNLNSFSKDIKDIENHLKKNGFTYDYLSKIYGKKKFRLLISTGDLPIKKFKLKNFIKYLYAKTFGIFIEMTNLNSIFKNKYSRDFTAGGHNAKFFGEELIEKKISIQTIKFPNGLDRNVKYFPNKKWKDIFDFYFTSSLMEDKLIKKKFPKKKTFYIGYTRFNEKNKQEEEIIKKEFNFNSTKETIYCSPTEWTMLTQNESSIISYINFLKLLDKRFNLVLRPHPKLKYTKFDYFKLLKDSGLNLDLNPFRKLHNLFNISNLIIADFGSSVLEAIYLKKKILIYNWQDEENHRIKFDKMNSLDGLIKNELLNTNNIQINDYSKYVYDLIRNKDYQSKVENLNLNLFGEEKQYMDPYNVIKNIYENTNNL